MENNDTLQITEIVEVTAGKECTAPCTRQESADVRESPANHRNLRLGGTLEQSCMSLMAIGVIAAMAVKTPFSKMLIMGACAVVFFAPFAIRLLRRQRGISPKQVCSILKKLGIIPVVSGDEIRWTVNGKESILRIHSQCQVVVAREYDIPSVPSVIDGNVKAAAETMKEVYLAKVSVRKDNGSNKLSFATESLCVSSRELSAYLPMYLKILDFAEIRQQQHITEMGERRSIKNRQRIGYLYSNGDIH